MIKSNVSGCSNYLHKALNISRLFKTNVSDILASEIIFTMFDVLKLKQGIPITIN